MMLGLRQAAANSCLLAFNSKGLVIILNSFRDVSAVSVLVQQPFCQGYQAGSATAWRIYFAWMKKIPFKPFFPDTNSQFNVFKSRAEFAFAASTWGIRCIGTAHPGGKDFYSQWSRQPTLAFQYIILRCPGGDSSLTALGNPVLSQELKSPGQIVRTIYTLLLSYCP